MSNDDVMTYEIEVNRDLYSAFVAICLEQELDVKEELKNCIEDYIASIQKEIEG